MSQRAIQNHEQRIRNLEQKSRSLTQRSYQDTGLAGGGGGGGGTYYADPGATTIALDATATLTVYEIATGGDINIGEKTVTNRYAGTTAASRRLILSANRDGSFTIIGQDCPT